MGSLWDALTRPCFLHQFKTFPSYLFFFTLPLNAFPTTKTFFRSRQLFIPPFLSHLRRNGCPCWDRREMKGSQPRGDGADSHTGRSSSSIWAVAPSPTGPRRARGTGGSLWGSEQLGTSDLGTKGQEREELAGLGFFLLPSLLTFLLMASPWSPTGVLKNGNPSLPFMPKHECHGADEKEQKAALLLAVLGVAGAPS